MSSSQLNPRFHVSDGGMYMGLSIPSPEVTLHLLRQQTQLPLATDTKQCRSCLTLQHALTRSPWTLRAAMAPLF